MDTEIKTKKKWPYLWYDPQTGLPFDFKPDNQPPKTPTSTRTTKLREELLKKPEEPTEPFPRHILTTPKAVFAGTTKSQRLRELAVSKILQEQQRRETLSKEAFKARTPPASIREDIQLRPQKTTNSQRLREEFARKAIEKRTDDTIAAFLETHRRVLSTTIDTSPTRFERKRSDSDTRIGDSKKNSEAPITEKKIKTNPRPIQGKEKGSATALNIQNSQTSLLNKKQNQTNLARLRHSSEPKLHQKAKRSANHRISGKKHENLSSSGKKPQLQAVASVDKVNKVISKNRVNFLKEKMKRISDNEGRNIQKPSYTEECLKMLNKSKTSLEEQEKLSIMRDKHFKIIMPPANQRGAQKPYSPSNRIRDMVRNSLSTTSDDDSSGSEV